MRTPRIAFLLVLLAGVASAQQPGSTSYTPDRRTDAPTFMNAEVVRVDRSANTVTFRSESKETRLTVEGEALGTLATLHAGDKVVVGYRVVKDIDGRETRYVTSVKPASPTSGEPGGRRIAANLSAGSTVRARVLSYDRGKRRVTVIDETGGIRSIPMGSGVTGLESLVPGANVAFNLGAAGNGVNVSGITSLGDTPVFANGVGFPPVNGQFVSFNQRTGLVTLDTATAGRVTFPAGGTVAGNFGTLRPGDNLSLNFDVTTGAGQAQAGGTQTSRNTVQSSAAISNFQTLPANQQGQTINRQGQTINQQGQLVNQQGQTVNQQGQTVNQQGQTVSQQGQAVSQQGQTVNQQGQTVSQQGQTGNQQGQTGNQQGQTVNQQGGQLVGTPNVGQGSPLLNPVPNVSSGSPVQAAVLPPATATAPQSAEEVGSMRAQGEADLANSAMALAAAANSIDTAWSGFKSQCLRGFTAERAPASGREWFLLAQGRILTPSDDSCRALYQDLTNRAQGFIQQLDTVEDAARKADVLPARVREVFERNRLR